MITKILTQTVRLLVGAGFPKGHSLVETSSLHALENSVGSYKDDISKLNDAIQKATEKEAIDAKTIEGLEYWVKEHRVKADKLDRISLDYETLKREASIQKAKLSEELDLSIKKLSDATMLSAKLKEALDRWTS